MSKIDDSAVAAFDGVEKSMVFLPLEIPRQYTRPMSVTPPMVTPSDLNEALQWTMRANRVWMTARFDDDAIEASKAWGTLEYCFAHYAELRSRAEPEVIAAHMRTREQHTTAA